MVIKHHLHPKKPSPEKNKHKIIIGRLIHSRSLDKLEIPPNALVAVDSNGRILEVSEYDEALLEATRKRYVEAEVLRLKGSQFLFPGLVDTHLHAPQWPNLALGMEGTLREWVEEWTDVMEASYSDTAKARRVYDDVVKTTLKLGSTTVAYNSTIHAPATEILARACLEAGQRAIVGKMCITQGSTHGNWEESVEASLADSEKSIIDILTLDPDPDRRRVHPCVQPRGGPYCPPSLMKGLGAQSTRFDTHVQAHMCETHSDIERTLNLHPGFTCYSDMYRANGLLHAKSILAHCIHLTPKDVQNLRETGAGVAHNPNSNTCLRDGECRLRDLLNAGIKVALGTDCSAGYMPSIQDAMRNASNVSRHLAMHLGNDKYTLGFNEVVYLATMGGAKVVGMEEEIGSFEVGKKFDALVVDVERVVSVEPSLWEGEEDGSEAMVKKWVFLGDDRNIRKVFVDGRLVAGHDLD